MKNLCLVISLFFLSWISTFAQDQAIEAEVDRYLAPYIQMNDFGGTVLVARGDKILLRKGYGMANYELAIPNNPKTVFQIASVTKTFTAAAIVLLEKQGKLQFDDPLSKFLPDFPNGNKIKISHLLTHSSGVPDFYALPEYDEIKTKPMTPEDWLALLKTKSPDFEPGSQNSYSNSGYFLLSLIIEKASGKTYSDFLREEIFKPLNMNDTGIWSDSKIIKNRASGYDPWIGQPGLINTPYYDKSVLLGSGSLYSNIDDLYNWYKAVHSGNLFRISALNVPYGWGPRKRFGRELIEQDGNDPGFAAHISAYLKDDLCIIVLSNIRTGVMDKIKQDLAAIVTKEKYEMTVIRKVIKVDPKVFQDYEGQYQISPKMILTVRTDGENLYLKGTGGYELPLEPLSETKYFYRQFYVPIVFDRDNEGKVTQMLWAGQYPFKKLIK